MPHPTVTLGVTLELVWAKGWLLNCKGGLAHSWGMVWPLALLPLRMTNALSERGRGIRQILLGACCPAGLLSWPHHSQPAGHRLKQDIGWDLCLGLLLLP